MPAMDAISAEVIRRCGMLAEFSEDSCYTVRTFLSEPMRAVHNHLRAWMEHAGMSVVTDHAGNLRGFYPAAGPYAPRLFIGSHLDTVPHAGAFDGILGVVLGVTLVGLLNGRRLPFAIEVIGFSEEEGVRFGIPFIGSRAFVGDADDELLGHCDSAGMSVNDAIRAFGLDPSRIRDARADDNAVGYLEFHIEQGPLLDNLNLPIGIVDTIAGQSRAELFFEGRASHAGTTPMNLRRDALAGAAEWISAAEREARSVSNAVATVGRVDVSPGAGNVIAGAVRASLDVRHATDVVRQDLTEQLLRCAEQIALRRRLTFSFAQRLDQAAGTMDSGLTDLLERAVTITGQPVHRMASGAGHDALIVARHMPACMLFLRSPNGLSHHPDESVLPEDVAAAVAIGMQFLEELERSRA